MDENECLNNLCTGLRVPIVAAWEAQIEHALLWNACCEAVAMVDHARLHRWRTTIDITKDVITSWFDVQHVVAANAFLACAELALEAKKLESQQDPDIVPLLHAAMQVLQLSCDCDIVHGQLWMSSRVQQILGKSDARDTARDATSRQRISIPAVDSVLGFLAARETRAEFPVTASWVWDVTRTLLESDRRIVCSRTIPVAGTDENGGFLAELILTVLEPGGGGIFHAYQDAFRTHVNGRFISGLRDAWQGARRLVQTQEAEVPVWDGRWQLRFQNRPLQEANDRSASGAAAWGWWHALTDKIPDERVIVVAQVDEKNIEQLQEVEGVAEKTQAIIEADRFDTIAVASAANKAEAERVLEEQGKLGPIRVVMPDDSVDARDAIQARLHHVRVNQNGDA